MPLDFSKFHLKFVGKLMKGMRKQQFKSTSVVLDRKFEFVNFILENVAGGYYTSCWP